MTPSSTTFELLKSLSQAEKRYFRTYASRHTINDQNLYLSLFDILNKQQDYDEVAAKSALERLGSAERNFASLKHFLQSMVLQSMREFHRSKHPHREVRDMVEDATFLHDKGLKESAIKMLQRAKKQAIMYEAHDILIHIAELEVEYQMAVDQELDSSHLSRFAELSDHALKSMHTNNHLKRLSFKLLYRARRNYSLRDREEATTLDEIRQESVLHQGHSDFMAQYLTARIFATLGQLQGDFESSFHHRGRILTLWDEFPAMRRVLPRLVATSASNYLAACRDTLRWEAMPAAIAKLNALQGDSPSESIEIQQNAAFYDLLYRMNTRDWDGAASRAETLKIMLRNHSALINKARLLAIRYNLGIFHFFMEQYSEALEMVLAIIHDDASQHREDVQQFARILQAVIHYELGNSDILDSMLRSARRFLDRREARYPFEERLIWVMNRLAGTASKSDKHRILTDFQARLLELKNDPENKDAPGLVELLYWVQSKLEGKRLRDTVGGMDG